MMGTHTSLDDRARSSRRGTARNAQLRRAHRPRLRRARGVGCVAGRRGTRLQAPEGAPRIRDRAREQGLREHVRRSLRRPLPGKHAACEGRAARELLRDRPREQRQLHLARRPASRRTSPTRPTASSSPTSSPPSCSLTAWRPARAASIPPRWPTSARSCPPTAPTGRPTRRTWATTPIARRPRAGIRRSSAVDETQKAEAGDGYATRHDPFVYFHSVIDERSLLRRTCRRARLAERGDAGSRAERRDRAGQRPAIGLSDARPSRSSPPTSATTATTTRASTSRAAPRRRRTSTSSWKRGSRRSRALPRFARAACSRSPSTSLTVPNRTPRHAVKSCPARARRCPASPAQAAAGSARSCSRRSSGPGP